MQTWKRKAVHFLKAVFVASLYYLVTYYLIYLVVAKEDKLAMTLWNLAFIIGMIALDKIEQLVIKRYYLKGTENGELATLSSDFLIIPFKAGLYLFYIVVVLCVAILAAEPQFPLLSDVSGYFLSVYYGILLVVAADKFNETMNNALAVRN